MLRRSSRIRQPPITFSPSTRNSAAAARITTTAQHRNETRVPFTLNKDKAIKKKAQATNREDACKVVPKQGGNIVIFFSTAAYEIVKRLILQHYSRNYMERSDIVPKDGATVEHIVTLYKDHTKCRKSKLYTINLYHTTSKILTNGQDPSTCIDHIQRIMAEINDDEINLLNNHIREKCNEASRSQTEQHETASSSRVHNTMPAITQAANANITDSILQENADTRNTDSDDSFTVTCPYCNLPTLTESIECGNCSQWVHIQCEGISMDRATEYEEDTTQSFNCNLCATLTQSQQEPETQSNTNSIMTNNTTNSRVGNSHLQIIKKQNIPVSTTTDSTSDTTHLKLPVTRHCIQTNNATSSRVGNSHLQIANKQITPVTTVTTTVTDPISHTTHPKLPATSHCTQIYNATSSRVGNSHLQIANKQITPVTTVTDPISHTTHPKLPATSHCTQIYNATSSRVGNSHLQIANKQITPVTTVTTTVTDPISHTTHPKLPATTHSNQTSHYNKQQSGELPLAKYGQPGTSNLSSNINTACTY